MDLKKLMSGANPQSIMLEQTRGLKGKWEKTGLLEGVGSETQKHGMAVMLENQAKQLLDEATRTGTSSGSEEWAGVALPLVRRIFGSIAAKEFVSVQPMNLPSGLIFYMDFKYGTNTTLGRPAVSESLFGNGGAFGKDNLSPAGNKLGSTQVAEGGLYGAGRFGYTINDTTAAVTATVTSGSASDFLGNETLSASFAATPNGWRKVKVGLPSNADYNGVRAFKVSGSTSVTVFPELTTVDSVGSASFYVSSSAVLVATDLVTQTLTYHVQPNDISRGDFEDRGADLAIPEIELELKSEPIVAKTRKLKAIWTPELAQDLNNLRVAM